MNQPLDEPCKRDAPRDRGFGERRDRCARGQSQSGDARENKVLFERGDWRIPVIHRLPVLVMSSFPEGLVRLCVPVHDELDVSVVVFDFVDVLRRRQWDKPDGGGENSAEESAEQHGPQCYATRCTTNN